MHPDRPQSARYDKVLFGIFIAVVALIVYGSLYPWVFEARQFPASPLYILLHSWDVNFLSRRFLGDVVVNIAIYIPLGMSAYLALRRYRSWALQIVGPVVLGSVLSASIEMLQLFTPERQCSAVDLVNNILGSALGVFAGFAFKEIVNLPVTGPEFHVRDRNAVALLMCWLSFLLYPLFPDASLAILRTKVSTFLHAPWLNPIPIVLSTSEWFAAGRLLVGAGVRRPILWLLALVALVPVQFLIVDHQPTPSDFTGPILAVVLFACLGRNPNADRLAGVALFIGLTLRALAPFHFEGPVQSFSWIPFIGLLGGSWQYAIATLLGKLFQYGATIWLLDRAGLGLARATVLVTVVLAAIEALQTHIPGHVPEISDPLMAVLLCLMFVVLRNRDRRRGNVELAGSV